MKKHLMFQASTVLSPGVSFVYQYEEASKVSCVNGEKVILKRKLPFVGCCCRRCICPQKIVTVPTLFTKQKEGSSLKRAGGTLDFTEDIKSCTGKKAHSTFCKCADCSNTELGCTFTLCVAWRRKPWLCSLCLAGLPLFQGGNNLCLALTLR